MNVARIPPYLPLFGRKYSRLTIDLADEATLTWILQDGSEGILLCNIGGHDDPLRLAARLAVVEATLGRTDGSTPVALLVGTARGVVAFPELARPIPRVEAIGIDARGLAVDLGLPVDAVGAAPIVAARGHCVLVARAAGVPAFELVNQSPYFADRVRASRADGFATIISAPRVETE